MGLSSLETVLKSHSHDITHTECETLSDNKTSFAMKWTSIQLGCSTVSHNWLPNKYLNEQLHHEEGQFLTWNIIFSEIKGVLL